LLRGRDAGGVCGEGEGEEEWSGPHSECFRYRSFRFTR
jgi:hypothetical protein